MPIIRLPNDSLRGKTAIVYTRVSSEDQAERLTHEAQEAECRQFAELNGLQVVRAINEQHTGSELWERRTLQAELDRLSRSAASKLAACDDLVTLAKQVQAFTRIPPMEDRRSVLVAFGVRVEADGRAWEFRIGAG